MIGGVYGGSLRRPAEFFLGGNGGGKPSNFVIFCLFSAHSWGSLRANAFFPNSMRGRGQILSLLPPPPSQCPWRYQAQASAAAGEYNASVLWLEQRYPVRICNTQRAYNNAFVERYLVRCVMHILDIGICSRYCTYRHSGLQSLHSILSFRQITVETFF